MTAYGNARRPTTVGRDSVPSTMVLCSWRPSRRTKEWIVPDIWLRRWRGYNSQVVCKCEQDVCHDLYKKIKIESVKSMKYGGVTIEYAKSVKYLGVLWDPKLHWELHITKQIGKPFASLWACKRVISKSWGGSLKISLWLHKMVLLLRLIYAAVVWWSCVRKEETRIQLRSPQGNFLKAAAGVMKTTYDAVKVASNWLPLDLFVKFKVGSTVYRLLCESERDRSSAKHAGLKYIKKHPMTLKQDRIDRSQQISKAFKTYIPRKENWSNVNKTEATKVLHWYTDGSGYGGRFGAGLYGVGEDYRDCGSLGTRSTVFQTEVFAIYQCTMLPNSRSNVDMNIYIWNDSQAASKTLSEPPTNSQLVRETMKALEGLGQRNRVTLA